MAAEMVRSELVRWPPVLSEAAIAVAKRVQVVREAACRGLSESEDLSLEFRWPRLRGAIRETAIVDTLR